MTMRAFFLMFSTYPAAFKVFANSLLRDQIQTFASFMLMFMLTDLTSYQLDKVAWDSRSSFTSSLYIVESVSRLTLL